MNEDTAANTRGPRNGINTNTYVSVSILISILGGFAIVLNTIYNARGELSVNQVRFEAKVDSLTERVDKFEKFHETWAFQDMFKWAVHLQRDNPNIKVPEPENKN